MPRAIGNSGATDDAVIGVVGCALEVRGEMAVRGDAEEVVDGVDAGAALGDDRIGGDAARTRAGGSRDAGSIHPEPALNRERVETQGAGGPERDVVGGAVEVERAAGGNARRRGHVV